MSLPGVDYERKVPDFAGPGLACADRDALELFG